jgi:uncharacterized protein YozE (UPF0346 family)
LNFKEWINQFKDLDNPIGDLTRDILNDGNFIDSNDYKEIRRYLNIDCNACYKAIHIFDQAWQEYEKEALS